MKYAFTAAMERALAEAAAWSSVPNAECLEAPALLLGLLTETECRAAITLARLGIGPDAVQRQWPNLTRSSARYPAWGEKAIAARPQGPEAVPVRRFASDLEASLAEATRRFRTGARSVELATEHVLFGLAAAHHEVSRWLLCQGVDAAAIEADIRRVHNEPPESSSEGVAFIPLEGVSGDGPNVAKTQDSVLSAPYSVLDAQHSASGAQGLEVSQECTPAERVRALRVIDAAANRGREGLRVVDDYVRFVLDDLHLTRLLKQLRHDLTAALGRFVMSERLAARETQSDVGTRVDTPGEQRRADSAEVLAANFARLQESLRSLEEFAKILDRDDAAQFEQLRYRSYTLQRAVDTTRASLERLAPARLYVLIDGCGTLAAFCRLAEQLVLSGVHVIQLREKNFDDRRLIERGRALREITAPAGVLFVMNDRPDLAVLARADGVHLGQEELSVKDARTIVGPEKLIGVSTHSIEQARQAVLDGASYLGVGPTFPSGTKHFAEFPGVALLQAVAQEIRLPCFAIGGINPENLPLVLEAGVSRVAVSGAIAGAPDPAAAVRKFLAALRERRG